MSFNPTLKLFAVAATSLVVSQASALADGFICQGLTYPTQIEVYNHVTPKLGTRNVAEMIVSQNKSLVAKFSRDQQVVIQSGATYVATVDERVKTKQNQDNKIADTTLGDLSKVELVVYFNYRTNTPSQNGQKFAGKAHYVKADNSRVSENVSCVRFKKQK